MVGAAVSGCSSDTPAFPPATRAAAPAPAPVASVDVSGTWYTRSMNNAVTCGLGEYVDAQTVMISQDNTDLTLVTSTGNTLTGILRRDIIEWSGDMPDRGGVMTYTAAGMITSAGTAAGNAAWTWSDGTDSCNGMMALTASQAWVLEESAHNSRPEIADVLSVTNGVAFASGVATTVNDYDYFQLVLDADAKVQIELSHFDLAVSDLDLELRNENNTRIAISESVDSFEMINIDLIAGTYYIGMIPIETPGDEMYYVSVDLN